MDNNNKAIEAVDDFLSKSDKLLQDIGIYSEACDEFLKTLDEEKIFEDRDDAKVMKARYFLNRAINSEDNDEISDAIQEFILKLIELKV